ncbi:hypothetical protein Tco_1091270 [Tanacetum coccineum]|uniref:Uncharacterized protein n=1 Tax=Tanacetum coccineum TaxID=301880 RepID=A0ABQ5I8X4_9ASTR
MMIKNLRLDQDGGPKEEGQEKNPQGDFHRLRIQVIEDMLLLSRARKSGQISTLRNVLHLMSAFKMFSEAFVIQRRVEDFKSGVESYQMKLNPHKADSLQIQSEKTRRYVFGSDLNDRLRELEWSFATAFWSQCDKHEKAYDPGIAVISLDLRSLIQPERIVLPRDIHFDPAPDMKLIKWVECRSVKVKEFSRKIKLKLFKNGMSKSSLNVAKSTRWAKFQDAKRLCLDDDLKMLKITMSKYKFKDQAQSRVHMINTTYSREVKSAS